uniref:NAD(P)-binding protein n=1 Tax=Entomoneis paludosa TaxID=265537 RepID=A0A7S2YFU2_9STRA|mmetsp:Transcript_30648/g.64014  ORF Transcript_30648/g.64014 Transcript_30648/m.64014 type:complete len:307 (+) Transcript_30648:292-1212(+)|eukprot:CAMPEP_0172447122 /NCGR_PEP_ID=MMETSP1065-20121228/6491_1 /TAXON_ID=265537 /ORGANISM="Amphiprora paludosa, Strain CCMP125" /LENGTH=306 /DNA_ID=CAMNT_0013198343 /DNA_START=275 /DNA_END=1195 /DNA_ORIENTATION=+
MSFRVSAAFQTAIKGEKNSSVALVSGGRSGIGLAVAKKLASFDFIDHVIAVSRSITPQDVAPYPKLVALAADVTTEEGRETIVSKVKEYHDKKQQLRYLVHSAGSIEPIKSVLDIKPEEMRKSMVLNCEAPFFLTTALYPFMKPMDSSGGVAGRVLHVSSGAAHGAPPVGWAAYGIGKAAFFQSYKVLEREFRQEGGHVVVGSFKPGVVDTSMQGTIRAASQDSMPVVENFRNMKAKTEEAKNSAPHKARPPPKGALDSPDNVAFFAEFLLLGTTDEEFANASDTNEYDIRDSKLYPLWIDEELLP